MVSTQLPGLTPSHSISAPSNPPSGRRVVCVFCGSSPGTSPGHLAAARALAHAFDKAGISLVYGGGTVGIMGELARTLVELSGPEAVLGIIPDALIKYEQQGGANTDAKNTLDESIYGRTTVVPDMHTRKQMMAREVIGGGPGSGFVALSGGFGTVEELMEMTTWNQLGIHGRGIVVFNVDGYFDGLLQWIRTAVTAGFISPGNAGILVEATQADDVIRQLDEYQVSKDRMSLNWTQK